MAHHPDPYLMPLYPAWEGQFPTFETWVNKASSWLTGDTRGRAVCVDMKGRICSCGGDFMRARDENAFPVRFFWEMTTDADYRYNPPMMGVRQARPGEPI